MGLITLVLVLAFSLLYLSKSLEKKPAAMSQAVDKINMHIDQLAFWGAIYGLVMAILTLIMGYSGSDMFVRLLANIMIVVMALPFVFDRLLAKFGEKVNPAIQEEAKNIVGWITKQEKYIGYVGAAIGVLLFAVLFR
jgi:hypothetical protein